MRSNAAYHTKRPPASNRGARCAWDFFVLGETLESKDRRGKKIAPRQRTPKEMTYRFMDFWVWVMEFTNKEYEEIDALEISGEAHHGE